MDRITERKGNGFVTFREKKQRKCEKTFCSYANCCESVVDRSCPYLKLIDRLADYEDTELTPEEVSKMQKDLAQTRQDLRMALDTAKANAQLLTRAKKCITDCETYLILGDGRYAARTIADWRKD